VEATVVNARFIKPLDEALLRDLGSHFAALLTVEENVVAGGFGSAVAEALDRLGLGHVAVHRVGIPDRFIDHGSQAMMRDALNLSADGIVREVRERWTHLFAAAATA
jgi:1-deoxy-D-xylulose-5-phosphate synthase